MVNTICEIIEQISCRIFFIGVELGSSCTDDWLATMFTPNGALYFLASLKHNCN